MEQINENAEIFVCDCHSREHQIVFQYDLDDNNVWCNIHLTNYRFLERLKRGIRYIFGYKCRYGHFDEFIFSYEHADKLIEMGNILKKNKNVSLYSNIKELKK